MDDDLLALLRKSFGSDVAMRMGEGRLSSVEVVPTGIATLDVALGGGVPTGRIIEIYGPESSGKTALACAMAGALQKHGFGVVIVDLEYAINPREAEQNGLKMDEVVISQPDSAQVAMSIVETIVRKSQQRQVIIFDSVAAMVTQKEVEADPGSAVVGETARLMSQMMRKLVGPTGTGEHVLIFTNQLRQKIGVMFGNPETTTGGWALKFYASLRLQLLNRQKVTEDGDVVGITTRVRVDKNKVFPPFKQAEFNILFDGTGIDRIGALVSVATDLGIIKKTGGSHYYPADAEKRFAGSGADALLFLKNHDDITQEIYSKVSEALAPK